MTTDGDINRTERESSLKHHVRSNVEHKTKENAPDQTTAQLGEIRIAEYHRSRNVLIFYYYLRSQSDNCGTIAIKVPFSNAPNFCFDHIYSMLQNMYTYAEKRVEYSYAISVLLECSGAEL